MNTQTLCGETTLNPERKKIKATREKRQMSYKKSQN